MFDGAIRTCFRAPLRNIAEETLKAFCERVASDETTLKDAETLEFFIRFASGMNRGLLSWLFEQRFPIRPFVDKIAPGRIFPGTAGPSLTLRRRWRLLKKRLYCVAGDGGDVRAVRNRIPSTAEANRFSALDTTTADLGPLAGFARRAERVSAAWRTHGKAVAARPAPEITGFSPRFKHLYWGGAGSRKMAFWERLTRCQTLELTEIRRLARDVSRRTGRVVLSWHNASVGAVGGWAFRDPVSSLEDREVRARFARAVRKEAAGIRKSFNVASAMELCSMRNERIFAGKLIENSSFALDGSGRGFKDAEPGGGFGPGACGADKHEWRGPLALHQRMSREMVLEWVENSRKGWADGVALLFALAREGRRLLDSGVIDSMVLPWIDKFFISSRRQADIDYLERLFRFVSENTESPPILFWDDTPHARAPSLGLALDRMAEAGLPFRGVGLFNTALSEGHAAERERAPGIIAGEYPQKALFALRPLTEKHCPGAFRRIFEDLDQSFFLDYDSSWKDDLAFLYAGTQVVPLLGTQTEMEPVSPWVVTGGGRCGFGAWFRRILRRASLGGNREAPEEIGLKYCGWANLL